MAETKIVINSSYGGFSLSDEANLRYKELANLDDDSDWSYSRYLKRTDPALIQTVEELGPRANGKHSKLEIVSVPAGMKYRIAEYDGQEWIETIESIDWSTA
jgi:hypothetical protein